MAEIKISDLNPVTVTPDGSELLAIVQADGQSGLDTFKATIDDLKPALEDNLSTGAPSWTTAGVLRAGHDIIAGYVDSGASTDGGGTIGLTLNDGYGNANITFNHTGGIPDRAGSSARITSSVDSSQELLDFQLKGGTTTGSVATLTSVLQLRDDSISLLQPTLLSTNGTSTTSLVNKGYIDTADTTERDARIAADSANLTSAKNHANSLVSTERDARIAADSTLTGDLSDLTDVVAGKIGEDEINSLHFTFANDTLSLNTIVEGQIGTGAVTTTKIDNYNVTANKLVGTENIQQGDFLIYDQSTGGFETTGSTAQVHDLFSPNHSDVDSNVTPSYGDSMYYNGTEWTTGNFGNYGADMEYMPISGVTNATFTNLIWSGVGGSGANLDAAAYYDRYFTINTGERFADTPRNIDTPVSGTFNPAIHELSEANATTGDNNSYDATLNDTTRIGFGSWWEAYGGADRTHSLSGSIQFPLANLTGTGLVNRNIRGLFIRVHNWLNATNSDRITKLYISYPDGSKKPLSEFVRKTAESGSVYSDLNQVILVPVNEGQAQIEIDFDLNRGTGEGIEFEIVGAQCTKRVELSPEIDIIQIIGSQLTQQAGQGYVDENTSTFENDPSVWTSEAPNTTGATDWTGVFPIEIPDNVSKSVITIVNNWNYGSAANEEIDHITMTVDWNANTIFGTYTWGSEYEETGFLYSTDLVGEKTFTVEQRTGDANTPTTIKFELNGRSIIKLPAPSHNANYPNTGQQYTIENYKTNAISTYKPYDNSFGFFFNSDSAQTYSTFNAGSSYISKDGSFIFSGGGGNYQLNGASPATLPQYSRVQIPLQTGEKVIEYYYSGDNYVSVFVLTDRGRVFGAGYGGIGQLGQGDLLEQKSFQLILEDVAWLGVGNGAVYYVHCIAILNDGTAYSWGNNGANELGRGTAQTYNNAANWTPGQIPGFGEGAANGKAVKAFALNSVSHGKSFIITEDRKVWSCGSANNGGLGHATDQSTFADTGRVGDYVVGSSHNSVKTVYIVDGTDLWAAGDNTYGQLGLGTSGAATNSFLFQQVTLTNGVSQIATAGDNASTAVLETDGSITVFGYNALGQLGTGDLTQRNSPTTITALGTNNKKVKLFGPDSYIAAYILKTDGTVFASGYNGYGQLGTGDLTNRSTFTKMVKEDRVFIKDFQLFGYNHYNAFVGVDQDDNLWGAGYNTSYKMLSTSNGLSVDRSVLTKIDAVDGVDSSTIAETGLGYDQTWVSYSNTARNISGTSYYNDTGKPIEVKGYFGGGSDAHNIHIHLTPLGGTEFEFTFATSTNSGGGVSSNGSMIIPPDTTYRFTKTGLGSVTYFGIYELR